jgi:hypothetical protein
MAKLLLMCDATRKTDMMMMMVMLVTMIEMMPVFVEMLQLLLWLMLSDDVREFCGGNDCKDGDDE